MAGVLMEISSENEKQIELMQPMWIEDIALLQPFPREESRLATPIKPFSGMVIFFKNGIFNYMICAILNNIPYSFIRFGFAF